jgi:nucleolar protein 56
MNQAAPNILALAGPLLGARLIALAGGIKKMALMPSSTIQLLGAEKALFRSLRTSSPPPKHGIIFQHPFLQKAKYWQRGKVARALAGKLAIAARIDTFGSGKVNQDFIDSLSRRVNEIQEKCEMRPKRKSY